MQDLREHELLELAAQHEESFVWQSADISAQAMAAALAPLRKTKDPKTYAAALKDPRAPK